MFMKTIKYILSILLITGTFVACDNNWDSHYSNQEQLIDNLNVVQVDMSTLDYLKSQSDYTTMYQFFDKTGVLTKMAEKNLLSTVFVLDNEDASSNKLPTDDEKFLAKAHISDISISPSNLTDGQRLLVWNGKYVNVSKDTADNNLSEIEFNNTRVKKVIKTTDGYIYQLSNYLNTPKSLYEMISSLSDQYSMFRDSVMVHNELTFDKKASKIIGVNETGSSVYDSVFVVTNPYFAERGFDIMSESQNSTLLIPSNDVINKALENAHSTLSRCGLQRDEKILKEWTMQAMFFNNKLSKTDFDETEDINSIFGKQWRTTAQKIDLDNPVILSNGIAYYVTDLKIPNNVIIYRVKDFMKWYEYLSEDEKAEYFKTDNLTFNNITTKVTAWSGWPGVFPDIINRVVYFNLTDPTSKEYTLDFTGFKYDETNKVATPYMIPPGEYDLCLGFEQKMGHDVEVSFNGEYIGTVTASQLTKTDFHYDRGGQGYPESYDISKATNKKKSNYDRDGGRVAVIKIGGTEPVKINIKFHGINATKCCFHHWCLKPTKNCY